MPPANRLTAINSSTTKSQNESGRLPTSWSGSPSLCAGRARPPQVLRLLGRRRKFLRVRRRSLRVGWPADGLVFVGQMLPGKPGARHQTSRFLESGERVLVVALLLICDSEMFPGGAVVSIQTVCFS